MLKQQKKTVLMIGEGKTEEIFLKHMQSLYASQAVTFQIKSATGGSPEMILHTAIKQSPYQYDRCYVLMDSDVPISDEVYEKAHAHGICIIKTEPMCLECMLLAVLDKKVPANSQKCKTQFANLLGVAGIQKRSLGKYFARDVLDNSINATIQALINVFLQL